MKIGTFLALDNIFKKKKWDIDNKNEASLYNRTSNLYEKLEIKEQKVLLTILEKMEYYTINNYEELLINCLLKMFDDCEDVVLYNFLPMLQNKNKLGLKIVVEKKNEKVSEKVGGIRTFFKLTPTFNTDKRILDIKSSMLVAYLLKSNTLQYHKKISDVKMYTKYYYSSEDIKRINRKQQVLVIIDDFIGTGGTALEAVKSLEEQGLDNNKIKIVSLISLKSGYEQLKKNNIDIYAGKIIKSVPELLSEDGWDQQSIDEFEVIIKSISKKVAKFPGKKTETNNTLLGYENSFALVSMIRTPNNVPSFLWDNNKNNNNMVIFPRF